MSLIRSLLCRTFCISFVFISCFCHSFVFVRSFTFCSFFADYSRTFCRSFVRCFVLFTACSLLLCSFFADCSGVFSLRFVRCYNCIPYSVLFDCRSLLGSLLLCTFVARSVRSHFVFLPFVRLYFVLFFRQLLSYFLPLIRCFVVIPYFLSLIRSLSFRTF